MTPLFLVSSALHTRFGIYTQSERTNQTILTINSIKKNFPSAKIILNESSGQSSITTEDIKKLPSVYRIFDHSTDEEIIRIHNTIDHEHIVKNQTEILATIKAFDTIRRDSLASGCNRIFKLSGRYILGEDFYKKNDYEGAELKSAIVVGAARRSQFDPYLTDGQLLQYMCRCWSFPTFLIEDIYKVYVTMLARFIEMIAKGKYLDLEHMLYIYLHQHVNIKEVPVLGVTGNIGLNGDWIFD